MIVTLQQMKQRVDALQGDFNHASRAADEEQDALALAAADVEAQQEAQAILQALAQQIQQQAHTQVAAIVSKCLEAIFEDPYQLRINFKQARGKTEAELTFLRDDIEVDPLDASGGGVVDVASFALRLAALILSRPARRRLLVLDEPFKHIHISHSKAIQQMLTTVAREMEVQIVMVTHNKSLQTGTVIELE